MIASALITFREGLEAALIVGILLGYLTRIKQNALARYVWLGAALAGIFSAATAMVLQALGVGLEEPYEQIFEGGTMLVAVIILTWMIFWMRYQSRFIKRDLENKVQTAISRRQDTALFALAFFAVLREGIETALFLSASAFADDAHSTLIGSSIGLFTAVAVGYAIYAMSIHLDLRRLFDVTSLFLLIFAAGLFARAAHEFQEIGWLPMQNQLAWDTSSLLANESVLGALLRTLLGYNAAPSILEVLSYLFYWIVLLFGIRWWTQRLGTNSAPQKT
jgi:high-affinity iron transporter